MRLSAQLARKITFVLMSLSLLAWTILIFKPGGKLEMEICRSLTTPESWSDLLSIARLTTLSEQWLAWSLMVLAMMSPKLILPLQQLVALSLKRLRLINASCFVLGYLGSWSLAAIPLLTLSLASQRYFGTSAMPALLVLILALIWQCSPYKQYCLNQGHQHKIIRAFGYQAGLDSLLFGLRHGLYCIGSGWLLMLLPMLSPHAHFLTMAAVTFIMLSEHLQSPRPLKWRFDLRLQLLVYLMRNLTTWMRRLVNLNT